MCLQINEEFVMFTLTQMTQFKHHKVGILFTLGVVAVNTFIALFFGEVKPVDIISGSDIVGEGSIVLFTLAWMVAAMASRPPGKVTRLLVAGLGFFLFSVSLDFLDEFMAYPDSAHWVTMIESYPAAIGMVIMTGALYQWHLEQRALNLQLRRREWDYRDHDEIDTITQLYRATYWQRQIETLQKSGTTLVIAVIDIDDFAMFNQRYGRAEGDRYLQEIAQLIVMNLRNHDLVCRYAGDRFAILLPGVTVAQASAMIEELKTSIAHVAFRHNNSASAIYTTARSGLLPLHPNDSIHRVLSTLLVKLDNTQHHAA